MSRGLPVIATASAGLGEWLEQGAGIELPDNMVPNQLAEAVSKVLDNQAQYSCRALEVAGSWHWRDHADLMMQQYASIVQ
jgi:glycosyltransferase involved in cell wall biosynthesis